MKFRLKITNNGNVTYTEWYTDTPANVLQVMQQARWSAPNARISIERAAGPPIVAPPEAEYSLSSEAAPTLGGDLHLAGHTIIGGLEKQTLIIDGGLL